MKILTQDDVRLQTENLTSADYTTGEVFEEVTK